MKKITICSLFALLFVGCATETTKIEKPTKVDAYKTIYQGAKMPVVAGGFYDQEISIDSPYQRESVFIKVENDPDVVTMKTIPSSQKMVNLASTDETLSALLEDTQRFMLLDSRTSTAGNAPQYLVSGAVTSVESTLGGRKMMSDLLDFGTEEVVTVKVVLNVTDRKTSKIIFSTEGEVNYRLAPAEVSAFKHQQIDIDALNRKVLHLAMKDGVNNLALAVDQGQLKL